MRIDPAAELQGELEVPGDKSVSHRYAILGAMAEGNTLIDGFSSSQDCHSTLRCIEALGCETRVRGRQVSIHSPGWQDLEQPNATLDAGNSGTTIRLLSAVLAAQRFETEISGDRSLNSRPMARITKPLGLMGARIEAREGQFPPLRITGAALSAIHYTLPVASAQVKSCILLAGLMASGETSVIEETPTRDHTERALPIFGAPCRRENTALIVRGPSRLTAQKVTVPGDLSSAIFFVVAALLAPRASVTIRGVGVNPTRTGLLGLLETSGAPVRKTNFRETTGEPICDLEIGQDRGFLDRFPAEVRGKLIPNLIDEIPILAILGTQAPAGLLIRDAAELRKKESDRIEAIVSNLRNIGIETEEFDDGFRIPPGQALEGGPVACCGDHRIAMAFAVAGLLSRRGVELDDPGCAGVSFPDFFPRLNSLRAG